MLEIDLNFDESFKLESGTSVKPLELRCSIYGELNEERSNAVLVFHALTGSSRIEDWWGNVLGESLDPLQYAFICINYLGSCYGSTDARELKKRRESGDGNLPLITIRDIANSQKRVLEELGVEKIEAAIGGSVGGMLALQFAMDNPEMVKHVIAIGAAPLSAQGLALNHIQRDALKTGDVKLARKIAMISYKSPAQLNARFGRKPNRNGEDPAADIKARFEVAGYLDYQGDIFEERFDTESYLLITKAMDLFDPSDEELSKIAGRVSLVGISSDQLFPASDVKNLAGRLSMLDLDSRYFELVSLDGHDAFLSDTDGINKILSEVFSEVASNTIGRKE